MTSQHRKTQTFRLAIVFILVLVMQYIPLKAQTEVEKDNEYGCRLSFSADKKIAKGLHLSLEEELRMDNDFKSFDRLQTTMNLEYKVNRNLKIGAGYALINGFSSTGSSFKNARHRFMADATGSLRLGVWRLSLKERFQATVRSGDMNEYQNPRTALTLKSRLKLEYKGMRNTEPYISVEMRNMFNAPVIDALYNGIDYLTETLSTTGEPGWFLDGFNKSYVNRLRTTVGSDFRLSKNSSIDISLMADYVMEYVVDANAEGTKLKSYTHETGFIGWLTVAYKYSF